MFSLKRNLLLTTGLVWLAVAAWADSSPAAAPADGGSIPVLYQNAVKRINLAVVSSSPAIAQLMQTAFSFHGAFDFSTAVPVQYVLHFEPAGAGRVGRGRNLNLGSAVRIDHPCDQLAVGGECGLMNVACLLQLRNDIGNASIDRLRRAGSAPAE